MVRKLVALLFGAVCSILSFSPAHATPAAALPVVNVSGTLSQNAEWVAGNVYVVTSTVTVLSGVTLTIDPAAIVKFAYGQALLVNGALSATGTSGSPIYFTSYRDDQIGGNTGGSNPLVGDWANLEFGAGSSSHIDFAVLRYSGYTGQSALQALGYTVPVVGDHVTFATNVANGIQLPGGQPSANTVLPSYPAAPYLVSGTITVPVGVTLTIDPGAILKFAYGQALIVNGTLSATGTSGSLIYFTSFRDDQIGGNTHGSGPLVGDWANIEFAAGSTTHIDFAALHYSGYTGQSALQALAYTVPVVGNNVTFASNVANGIQLPGGQPAANTELPSYPAAPYLVSGTITVPVGVTLTIDPGAILKFAYGQALIVNGTLSATGTSGSPIYFTSYRDAQIGGNTHGSGPLVGDWANIEFAAGSTTHIDFAVLRYSGYTGQSALQALAYTVPVVGNNVTFASNVANGIQLPGGQPAANTELPSYPAAPYLVSGTITVPVGVTLTIDPGAILKFAYGQALIVNGTLSATGTSGSLIYFTSFRDDQIGGNTHGSGPLVGDWANIEFAAGSTTHIDFAVLRYSGYTGQSALQALGYTVPVVGNHVTFATNVANGIQLPGGQPAGNTELPSYPAAPYLVSGTITVPSGVTLTIDPGAVVKFGYGQGLVINGALSAMGTSGSPIYFTSYRDDQIGGNTDGTAPRAGDWLGIQVRNGSSSLNYSVARYGGYASNGVLFLNGGLLTVTNSCVANSIYGLYATSIGATITNSWISGNLNAGVFSSVTGPLNATYNWWGSPSGPTSPSNPGGTGDAVSAGVSYLPFVTAPGMSCFVPPLPPAPGVVTNLPAPVRVVDTRLAGGPIPTGTSRCFGVTGILGIPANAAALVLNATAVGYGTNGWLTVYPNGQAVPSTSTLNFDTHEYAMATGTVMRVGTGGQICVNVGTLNATPGNSQVILDVTGYLTSNGLTLMPMLAAPQRVFDTRLSGGGPIATGTSRCFVVTGLLGIPADAAALVVSLTAVGYGTNGWLTLYPNGAGVPATSTLNFDTNEYAMANGSIARVGTGGQVCVNVGTLNATPGNSQVILDVTGYLTSNGLAQMPMLPSPQRLWDTRLAGGPIATGETRCFSLVNIAGIPINATAVVINVTSVAYSADGWLTAFPYGQAVPTTSTLNFAVAEYAVANEAIIALAGGQVCINVGMLNNAPANAQVIIDVVGYQ